MGCWVSRQCCSGDHITHLLWLGVAASHPWPCRVSHLRSEAGIVGLITDLAQFWGCRLWSRHFSLNSGYCDPSIPITPHSLWGWQRSWVQRGSGWQWHRRRWWPCAGPRRNARERSSSCGVRRWAVGGCGVRLIWGGNAGFRRMVMHLGRSSDSG